MTIIQKLATKEAVRLVNRLWATYWIYNNRTFEGAKSAAIICARAMMKEYNGQVPASCRTQRYDVLKSLTKAIYSIKYHKP